MADDTVPEDTASASVPADQPPPDPPDGDEAIIERYFAAMRRGAAAEDEMMALFADDAVYVEPFSGQGPAVGRAAIRQRLRLGWAVELPDVELDVLSLDLGGADATAIWECRSAAWPGPRRGRDRYRFVDGRIVRLEVTIDDG